MNAKTILMALSLCIALGACNSMERKEKNLVKAMQSEDFETVNNAYDEFCTWVKGDKATMDYDFNHMREQLGLHIVTSPDSCLRCYSWVTGGTDSIPTWANIIQWISGEDMMGYSGSLDVMLTGRKAQIKYHGSLAHSIDTIYQINGKGQPIYLIVQSYSTEGGHGYAYVSAVVNMKLKLANLPNFFEGVECAGYRQFINDGTVDKKKLILWDEKSQLLRVYLTDDSLRVVPGQYETFLLGASGLTREATQQ